MIYVGIILLAFLTWFFPIKGKLIAIGINMFVKDPLPFGDEIIMVIGLTKMSYENTSSSEKMKIIANYFKQAFKK